MVSTVVATAYHPSLLLTTIRSLDKLCLIGTATKKHYVTARPQTMLPMRSCRFPNRLKKLKEFGDCEPTMAIAIVPDPETGWSAIVAANRSRAKLPLCQKRISFQFSLPSTLPLCTVQLPLLVETDRISTFFLVIGLNAILVFPASNPVPPLLEQLENPASKLTIMRRAPPWLAATMVIVWPLKDGVRTASGPLRWPAT